MDATQRADQGAAEHVVPLPGLAVNAPLLRIADQTRHRTLAMLQVYARRVDMFKDWAGAS